MAFQRGRRCPRLCQHLVLPSSLMLNSLMDVQQHLIIVLICITLIISEFESLFL